MWEFFADFQPSDWLELIGIVASFVTSVVAIWISLKTLKQNNLMIEESSRPYIAVSGKTTNFQNVNFYLILKNYGNSGATITKFTCNHDLREFSHVGNMSPFSNICGTFIAPGQSFMTNLNTEKCSKETVIFKFDIEYKSQNKLYEEHFEINMDSYRDLIQTRASTNNKELKIISYALQDISEKLL